MAEDKNFIAQLEQSGERQVRLALERNEYQSGQVHTVYKWLAEKDQEATRVKEASQAEQIEIARSAARAAERAAAAAEKANTRATSALVIAVISIIATIIAALIGAHALPGT